jgi:phage baseplate assembly protein W
MANLYKGFSTINRYKKFRLTDFELAKQDLFNHLHIRKGEKLMNPEFGTIIWNLLYEPFSATVKELISNDLIRIVKHDPRLFLENIYVTEVESGLMIQIEIRFKQTNELGTLTMQFDQGTPA